MALAAVLLLLFGPRRLPEIGRSLGRGMREFKDSVTSPAESWQDSSDDQIDPRFAEAPSTPKRADSEDLAA